MRLEALTMDELVDVSNCARCKKKKIMKMIEEFMNSDQQVVKVEFTEQEYKNLKSATESFRLSVKRMKAGVNIMTRKGKLYLIKEI